MRCKTLHACRDCMQWRLMRALKPCMASTRVVALARVPTQWCAATLTLHVSTLLNVANAQTARASVKHQSASAPESLRRRTCRYSCWPRRSPYTSRGRRTSQTRSQRSCTPRARAPRTRPQARLSCGRRRWAWCGSSAPAAPARWRPAPRCLPPASPPSLHAPCSLSHCLTQNGQTLPAVALHCDSCAHGWPVCAALPASHLHQGQAPLKALSCAHDAKQHQGENVRRAHRRSSGSQTCWRASRRGSS